MEQDKLEQLCGTVENVTFRNEENGYTVLVLAEEDGGLVTAVGVLAGCVPGEQVVLTGRMTEHRAYGPQFEISACEAMLPTAKADILKYLSSGLLPGIGAGTAGRIVQKFGTDALEILATEPRRLAEVKGVSPEKALEASKRFIELFGMREAVASLSRFGLTVAEGIALYGQHGKATLGMVRENPYRLCGHPLFIHFARADAMARSLWDEPDDERRTQAALVYTMRHNLGNGHTCLPREKLLKTVSGYFGIAPDLAVQQLEALCEERQAVCVDAGRDTYVYLAEPYNAEAEAARRIREIACRPKDAGETEDGAMQRLRRLEAAEGIAFAPLQARAIAQALCGGCTVITGGPGTGKTTAVNAIITLYEQQAQRVLLAAPTGRAAKRMGEVTGRQAATIHRLLEVEFGSGEHPRFKRNAENPLRCDVLVVDEMSMVDAFLFENLLAALRPAARLVMVGDADQLPSVGPGNVLRGIIDSGVVPVVCLKDIFRQAASSLIVQNAHRIVEGQMPQQGAKADDFFLMRAAGEDCRRLVCELVARRLPKSYGYSPIADIQVLCPGKKGANGTEALNAALQALLNPPGPDKPELKRFGVCFRRGDKVMQTRNNYDLPYTRLNGEPGAGVYNGDIGTVESISPQAGSMVVLCDERRVQYNMDNIHELELAYAITIHKSQGSEFEAVVMALSDVPGRLQYRNLLYTGVTRAKKLCVLAGENRVVEAMVRAGNRSRRYSCFARLLRGEGRG